jgi:hypothetical protein
LFALSSVDEEIKVDIVIETSFSMAPAAKNRTVYDFPFLASIVNPVTMKN